MADDSFLKKIKDSQFGELLEFGGKINSAIGFVSTVSSLFSESDTTKILNAIDQLRQDLEREFTQLGDLIVQQTETIVDATNRAAMATALSHSDAGRLSLERALGIGDNEAMLIAENESNIGVQFFLNLGTAQPFFIPGLIKAGTIRIMVIAAQDSSIGALPGVIDQVNEMIADLEAMIRKIKRTVDASHETVRKSHIERCPANPQLNPISPLAARDVLIIDGFSHLPDDQTLTFFNARLNGQNRCEPSPSTLVQRARTSADDARNRGVVAELEAIGVPRYEEVVRAWSDFLNRR